MNDRLTAGQVAALSVGALRYGRLLFTAYRHYCAVHDPIDTITYDGIALEWDGMGPVCREAWNIAGDTAFGEASSALRDAGVAVAAANGACARVHADREDLAKANVQLRASNDVALDRVASAESEVAGLKRALTEANAKLRTIDETYRNAFRALGGR